jgi:hypothetical protein
MDNCVSLLLGITKIYLIFSGPVLQPVVMQWVGKRSGKVLEKSFY